MKKPQASHTPSAEAAPFESLGRQLRSRPFKLATPNHFELPAHPSASRPFAPSTQTAVPNVQVQLERVKTARFDPVGVRLFPEGNPAIQASRPNEEAEAAADKHSTGATAQQTLEPYTVAAISPATVGDQMLQPYAITRASDGGNMVGEAAACHCHIDIGSPHFKVGKDQGSRINFGRDMSLERMQMAYNAMLARHSGKAGYEDCKEYLEEQGCVEQEEEDPVILLKSMLVKWGGLGDDKILFYNDEGHREERPVYAEDQLNETILAAEAEIMNSNNIYSDFLDEGSFLSPENQDIDVDDMEAEQNALYEKERRKVQGQ
ncbi:MAG: hypothetical protein HC816_06220 [Leptolyngbyaceae cyanobacterium RM1_1_2]|nr:hypothetical protein [Leptolyngbyaceae cyanobacterium RM1_1_2]